VSKKLRTSIEAKRNRLRRRISSGIGELAGSICVLFSVVLLCLVFIYGYSFLISCSYFEIKETSIRGLKELTEKDVLVLAGIKPQQNLLAINTDVVARRIAANPWVKNIYVGREFPNRLVLEVRERMPLALVKRASSLYLMDGEGNIFKKLGKSDEVDLPILTGFNGADKRKSQLLFSTFDLLKRMAASGRYNYLGSISEVHVDDVFGLSLLTDTGLYLKMGNNDYENKLKQLNLVMADLDKRGLGKGHICVDLSDITKITIQRKNAVGRPEPVKKSRQYKT
jgi:cell division protein FtsQ